jgi:IS5 family transposase
MIGSFVAGGERAVIHVVVFGFVKVRYRGLKKNTAQLTTLFALSNLWMARPKLLKM